VLPLSPITWAAPLSSDAPASRILLQDPKAALPVVSLAEQSGAKQLPFALRQDLLHSGPRDRHFTVEVNNLGQAVLRFGDGTTGRPPGGPIVVSCRVGNGPAGNLPAESIAHLIHDPDAPELSGHVLRVRNPLPAAGGQSAESLAEVRRSVPWAFRTQQRAVTESDYVDAALRYDDVQQASGRWQWTGSGYTLYLTVNRQGGRAVDSSFVAGLLDSLEPLRLIGHELQIEAPIAVPLEIALTVYVEKDSLRSTVRQALLAVFSNSLLPDGQRGYFYPDNLRLGASVYLSQIVSAAIAVSGVDWIDASPQTPFNRFQRAGAQQRDELVSGKISLGPRELAQVLNDPQRPTAGRIAFDLRGGL
jgi:predicted phage baseplate assembly protein